MTRQLQAGRHGPAKGTAAQVLVLLHGYGADGNDLLGLSEPLTPHLPGTVFYAPDAPERAAAAPFGRQWFPIPWIDGSSEAEATAGLFRAADDLQAFLDQVLADEGVAAGRLALLGFSQGTMMSLHVGPRRAEAVAGIVGFSGRLLQGDRLAEEGTTRPPILLLHGDQDEVVPYASMDDAAETLTAAGFETRTYTMQGVGHGISPEGLGQAVGFLRQVWQIG